jgi:hypothetical protein
MLADGMMRGEEGSEFEACHGFLSGRLLLLIGSASKLRAGEGQGNRQWALLSMRQAAMDEVIDRAFEVEHGPADMDQFGDTLAENVNAEQPADLGRRSFSSCCC